ncbi:hypothetical protein K469DRAFT_132345 [Zopfia rhizophila CBS 207.26]|uniref:Uncharacterized protein n=1 Tax=Zopfia rhizophila CBS 207.26 TaxID=1314779 RepID=A0A6A6EUN3_9PEZI|nr:hypothetical protein K469DRAFT_132345 [Zopfia rhizophila CBS 207.26]
MYPGFSLTVLSMKFASSFCLCFLMQYNINYLLCYYLYMNVLSFYFKRLFAGSHWLTPSLLTLVSLAAQPSSVAGIASGRRGNEDI